MTEAALTDAERHSLERNVPRFYLYTALTSLQLWIPIWIVYLQEQRGLSLTEITFLDMPFFLTQMLAEVPTGALADRYGRKISLLLGGVTLTVAVFVFGIADNYALILISYVFWGVGMGLQSGADQAFLFDSLKLLGREGDYSRIFGRVNATTVAANVIAGLAGAPLAAETTLATPILISAGITAASVLVALTFHEPPLHEARLPYLQTVVAGVREVRGRRVLRLVMLFAVLGSMSSMVTQYFMQPYLKGHGASTASLGLLMTPVRLVSVAASFAAFRVERRLGAWTALAMTPVLPIAACVALAAWDSIYAFAFVPMAAAGGTLRMLLVSHYVNARIASQQRATIISLFALATALASSFLAPLYGYVADERSLRALYGGVAVFSACSLPVVIYFWRRAERAEIEPGPTAAA
ncbi:MAG TPA: MFS transporter [Dehalococcoidia bacterium]|nr:MFS transporter [Dehalococcoidia bacterium]